MMRPGLLIFAGGFCLSAGLSPWHTEADWHHYADAFCLAFAAMYFACAIINAIKMGKP